MPIPQLEKSGFHRRKISGAQPAGFSSRRIVSDVKKKKRRIKRPSFRKQPKHHKSGGWFKKLSKRLWPFLLGGVFLFGIFVVAMFAWYSKDLPQEDQLMN